MLSKGRNNFVRLCFQAEESSVFTNNINEIMHLNIKVYKDLYQCKVCDNAQRLLLHNGGSVSAIKEQE